MKSFSWLAALGLSTALVTEAKTYLAYIGTYTGAQSQSKGIYAFRFDTATGVIEELGLVAETPNPTFLALHPNGRFLYAANEIADFKGAKSGSISAYQIDRTSGKLSLLGAAATTGDGPCHLNVDAAGHLLAFANYGGGSVGSMTIAADGRLGDPGTFFQHRGSSIDPARQKEPHAHSVNFSPDNRFVFACDLGTDEIRGYRVDPNRGLVAAPELTTKTVAGGGPRHLTFGSGAHQVYVNNEMQSSVTVFNYDAAKGRLQRQQTLSTLPAGFTGTSSTAETRTSTDGQWLFVSNRGHDSLARFKIAAGSGALTPAGHIPTGGRTPRNFCPSPDGHFIWAANQDTDNILVFRFDSNTGEAQRTGQELKVGRPVCIRFLEVN